MTQPAFDWSGTGAEIRIERVPQTARETRQAGHQKALGSRESLHGRMLAIYALGPRTDAEMAFALGVERSTVNARRAELVKLGKVQDRQQARTNPQTGMKNSTWGLVR